MPTISVSLIAHNEAAVLAECLASVRWADQIVLVDCESTDATADIARRYGAEVDQAQNVQNLNINKNRAIGCARCDWVLLLDADERVPDTCAGEIRRVIQNPEVNGWMIPRRNYMLGRWVKHGGNYPDYQLRLFRNDTGRFPAQHVHERLTVQGRVGTLREPFDHLPYPDLGSFIGKNLRNAAFEGNFLRNRGIRIGDAGLVWWLLVRVPWRFFRKAFLKGGFRDGIPGLIHAWFDAFSFALRRMYLWEYTRSGGKRGSQ